MRKFGILILIWLAFLTRFLLLDNKPVHFDESINGWFVMQMKTLGFYKYDPQNYHGPLHFYLLQIWNQIFGESLISMRALTSFFSFAAVLFFIRRSIWTAVFLALSPSLIFFGRSAIHEMGFVFSQMLFFVGLYEYQKARRLGSLWWALLGFLGMASMKETFVFTGFAAVLAIATTFPWKSFIRDMWGPMRLPILFVVFALATLFSGFGKNFAGILDFFRAFTFWGETGVTSGHNKSFWYWTDLAAQAEPLLLFAGVLAFALVFNKKYRTLSLFAMTGWLLYSIVPYKTPWCMISWSWPFYYLLGEVMADLKLAPLRLRMPAIILVSALLALGSQSLWNSVYKYPIDMEHPFVYVNSTYEFKRLDERIQEILNTKPEMQAEAIQISLEEMWPMPWTLRDSKALRYERFEDSIFPDALVYFCEETDVELLDKSIAERYVSKTMPLRQFGRPVHIFLRKDVFGEFP